MAANLEKLEVKKTKVVLTLSMDITPFRTEETAFKHLLVTALLSGASANSLKALLIDKNQKIDFKKISLIRNENLDNVGDLFTEIDELNMNCLTTKFK